MTRKEADQRKMVKALTWRISLSLIVFILLLIGFLMGWLTPHALIMLNNTPV
jgi:hypothetical protein